MVSEPGDPPPSWDRRRLLLAFGAGAVNVAVLHRIEVPRRSASSPTAGSTSAPGPDESVAGGGGGPGSVDPAGPDAGVGRAPTTPGMSVEVPTGTPPSLPGAADAPGPDHVFDLVIAGGRVMDPASGFDGLVDVGIDGDRIAALSAVTLRGRRTIDASGRVVAPGFVDLLSAEPNPFGVWLKLADGVTTNLAMHGVNNYAPAFFDRYDGRTPIHFGGAFHQHFMRSTDLGVGVEDELSLDQLNTFDALARQSLAQGFAGLSMSPEYSPGTSTGELIRLATTAAELGQVMFFHARFSDPHPPGTSAEALDEIVEVARRTGVSVHIEHLTSTGGTFMMAEALDKLDAARSEGLDVTACLYPYDFWGTFLASPRFALGWQDRYGLDYGDLQVAGTEVRLSEATYEDALRENKLVAALGSIPEEELRLALGRPWIMISSDAILNPDLNNHPRAAGTFARTLGRYVRELEVLDLTTALAKMTILPTRRVESMLPAMARKGRLQRGADADIVVFDPTTIADLATVANPDRPSAGIDWVLVEGTVALGDGEVRRDVSAGRALTSSVQ